MRTLHGLRATGPARPAVASLRGLAAAVVGALGWVACGDAPVEPPPPRGVLLITVATAGVDLPTTDYGSSVIDPSGAGGFHWLATNGSTEIQLAAGAYVVEVDLPANCTSAEPHPQDVTISPNDTVTVALHVTCGPAGAMAFTVNTCGTSADADGYTLWIDGAAVVDVGSQGRTLIPLTTGRHHVRVAGVASNCTAVVAEDGLVDIRYLGDTVATTVGVFCEVEQQQRVVFQEITGEWGDACGPLPGICGGYDSRLVVVGSDGGCRAPITDRYGTADHGPAASPDGRTLAFLRRYAGVYLVNPDGSGLTRLAPYYLTGASVAWSPDGERLAFGCSAASGGALCLLRRDGSESVRYPLSATPWGSPVWSPDGSRMALVGADQTGASWIWIVNAEGTGGTRVSSGTRDTDPAWSPDGFRLTFARSTAPGTGGGLYIMNADGSDEHLVVQGMVSGARWSPDGSELAFIHSQDGTSASVCLVKADGSQLRTIADGTGTSLTTAPRWSPDGSQLLFVRDVAGATQSWEATHVWIVNSGGTALTDLGPGRSPLWLPR